ncbi:MAG: GNAT family protein [Hyphomicrobium sp.]
MRGWKGVARPARSILEGRYCRLEPLDVARHAEALFAAAMAPGREERFRYLFEREPSSFEEFRGWVEKSSVSEDPLFFAVVNKATGLAEGRQAFMRIDPANGVIEIGGIMWGPAIARTRVATEALFLFADYAFSEGYRRFEWKCDNRNLPSKRAADRFGFRLEGLFRQHMVVKGENRDTAWFSIIDNEWPRLKVVYQAWLAPENFDETGHQRRKLIIDQMLGSPA